MQKLFSLFLIVLLSSKIFCQQSINLKDLSNFDSKANNWTIIADAKGVYDSKNLNIINGTGILFNNKNNMADPKTAEDLFTKFDHGDIAFKTDFMLPAGSNSGIYFMGRYEIQLYDSWGITKPKFIDCGAVYERWNDTRGKGNEGFEGQAPRQNACLAPGLWQTLEVNFSAPKFDNNGKKIRNAVFNKVVLNGIIIHENVEITGPTRAAYFIDEKPRGPIQIQGTHGEVAFKNMQYELLDKNGVKMGPVTYQYFDKKFDFIPAKIEVPKPASTGILEKINYRVAEKSIGFIVKFNTQIEVTETDEYYFSLPLSGNGRLLINNQVLIDYPNHVQREDTQVEKSMKLPAGKHNLEVWYSKPWAWNSRALGLYIRRNGMKKQALHEFVSLPDADPVGDINLGQANYKTKIQRSFLMHNGRKRTHITNVSLANGPNYSYDLASGSLLKVWKGPFLNVNEMWHERGEPQLALPLGVTVDMEGIKDIFTGNVEIATISKDSTLRAKNLKYLGYILSENGTPTYKYSTQNGKFLKDNIIANEAKNGLLRTIMVEGSENDTVVLAAGNDLLDLGNGLFKTSHYYIKSSESIEIKPSENTQKILVGQVKNGKFSYEIIW